MNYLIVDTNNLLFRARHVVRATDINTKIGMALHIMLSSFVSTSRNFDIDHVVFCFEGRSWRKQYYSPYKLQRKLAQSEKSISEREEDEAFMEMLNDVKTFLEDKTNVTVFRNENVEADDCVALWIQNHPNDNHIILSSDTDFMQLVSDNVKIFNGIEGEIIQKDGIFDIKGKRVKKKNEYVTFVDSEYLLFEKIIRGDATDGVKPAYPGVRKKGTKNKIGITQAFEDRHEQGFDWVNFMNAVWTDENGIDHVVKDDFERNKMLIDLSCQPEEIRNSLNEQISEIKNDNKNVKNVGFNFLKFCGKYELIKISENPQEIVGLLSKPLRS